MGEDRIVISSAQATSPETVTNRSFASAFRGYHPAEVRQFLKRVSDEMAAAAEREAGLHRALQEAEARAAHPELDEATLTGLLGEHAARLLAGARDTAASITTEARDQAEALLRNAEARVARLRQEADGLLAQRVAEADAAADSVRAEARAEARAVIERATEQGKEMVAEARAVRERMLADLNRRRRAAQVQIEQLRAARDRLVAAYDVVRRTVEEATAELDAAEPEARLAAEEAGRRAEGSDAALGADPLSLPAPAPVERVRMPATATARPPGVPAGGRARKGQEADNGATPATALFRRLEAPAPAQPEPPRLRPQTVASSVAGRPAVAPPAPSTGAVAAPPRVPAMPAPPGVPTEPAPAPARAESATATEPPETTPAGALAPAPTEPAEPAPALAPEPSPVTFSADAVAPAPAPTEPAAPATRTAPVRPAVPASELAASEVSPIGAGGVPPPVGAVDELFARIRAEAPPAPAGPAPEPAPSRSPAGPAAHPVRPAQLAPAVDPVVGERALEGRDALLENLEAGLARALKRVLGDEQNEVLDSLRRLGPAAADRILPPSGAQLAGYREAALPWLQQAVQAGAGFVSGPEPGSAAVTGEVAAAEARAAALAEELVEPLRARLARALAAGADVADPSVAAENLRGTYRQWKVQQVEERARDHALAAFSLGAFAATPAATSLQWLVDGDGHCPDCDDNALAGPTAKGEAFPTGQLHPPAHPGCRCLLVPLPD